LIKIHSVQIDFIANEPPKNEKKKFALMPFNLENTGVVFLDVKQRGFKFTFKNVSIF